MSGEVYQFRDIRVDSRTFNISKAGTPVVLEPKTFLLLVFLIENRDRLVEKREILDEIWKDVAVTENALTREIGKLRKALGDDPKAPKYIQTVHTRGYRFIAPVGVVKLQPETPEVGPPPHTRVRSWLTPGLLAAVGAIIVVSTLGSFLKRSVAAPSLSRDVKAGPSTLAVLPFQSLGAGPNDQYVGLAMADAVITKLSRSTALAIQPTSTVLRYAGAKQDSLSVGRLMKMDYVLEGKFQTQNDRMRVTVQLLCVSCPKTSRWAGSFDEKSSDIFQVEDSISEKVVSALTLELNGEQYKRLREHPTSNVEAQLAFAKGVMFLQNDTKGSLDKAIELFQMAVDRDPDYAAAWAYLSDSTRRREWYGASPSDVMVKTRTAAMKAVALDDELVYGHSMLGFVAFQYDWNFEAAEREYKRAIALQPSFVHQWYARYLLAMNRPAEAEAEYHRYLVRSSSSVSGMTHVAEFEYLTRQYGRAGAQLHDTLSLDPNYAPAHEILGLVYEQQGRQESAREELQKAVELSRGFVGLGSLGHLYATQGRSADVQKVLGDLAAQSKERYVAPFELALIQAGLGKTKAAIDDLEKAYDDRSLSAQSLRSDPRLDDVRSEPRFHEFVKRIGLPF